MCTLTFIPVSEKQWCITSNRDESTQRDEASLPQYVKLNNERRMLSPVDGKAGGSWLALSDHKQMAVVLNGAFERHKHLPPYRKSRGLVLRDAFGYDNFRDFTQDYGLIGIEPFTMVLFSWNDAMEILVVQWNGEEKFVSEVDATAPQIWLAPTLYPKFSRDQSREEFDTLLAKNEPSPELMLQFHHTQHYAEKMKRHGLPAIPTLDTLSISQAVVQNSHIALGHYDLLHNLEAHYNLEFK